MSPGKMHAGEAQVDEDLVRRLVAVQFPQWSDLPMWEVRSTGTVNVIYRLGDHLCARLPRVREWARDLEKEWHWLPRLAPRLPLQIPEPVGKGCPAFSYPFPWAIYGWIDGQPYADDLVEDEIRAAGGLARFVGDLRQIETAGAPRGGRPPLRELDAATRAAIEASRPEVEFEAATTAWERALEAPAWDGRPAWIHADLLRPNLLVRGGRLSAVIDFGAAGVGDPAADLVPAWSVFGRDGRETYRAALDAEDGAWDRARGYALHQAALIVPYYRETNPGLVSAAKRTVEEVIVDTQA